MNHQDKKLTTRGKLIVVNFKDVWMDFSGRNRYVFFVLNLRYSCLESHPRISRETTSWYVKGPTSFTLAFLPRSISSGFVTLKKWNFKNIGTDGDDHFSYVSVPFTSGSLCWKRMSENHFFDGFSAFDYLPQKVH